MSRVLRLCPMGSALSIWGWILASRSHYKYIVLSWTIQSRNTRVNRDMARGQTDNWFRGRKKKGGTESHSRIERATLEITRHNLAGLNRTPMGHKTGVRGRRFDNFSVELS